MPKSKRKLEGGQIIAKTVDEIIDKYTWEREHQIEIGKLDITKLRNQFKAELYKAIIRGEGFPKKSKIYKATEAKISSFSLNDLNDACNETINTCRQSIARTMWQDDDMKEINK